MSQLTFEDLRSLRLTSLLLADHKLTTAEGVVSWFGAMQAQDLASVKWSLGVRLPQLTEIDIDTALNSGAILRTWPMRGTIHLISASDARWMLQTVGSRQLAGVDKRWERLGLDRKTVERAGEVLAAGMHGNRRLTRSECAASLQASGIETSSQRLYHLLWYSSQVGITCIGPNVGKEQTFVLLNDFAPDQRQLVGAEALAELAWLYVRSHGPIPASDFAGWAGIPVTAARRALADNDGRLTRLDTAMGDQWMRDDLLEERQGSTDPVEVLALPGFDEFMLGYKDRTAMLDPDHMRFVVPGSNGMFRPTIVDRGTVIGVWTRNLTKAKVKVQAEPFGAFSKRQRSSFESSIAGFARYLGVPAHVVAT